MKETKYRIWLDDLREMPKVFNIKFTNAPECIDFIKNNLENIESISFDNDLGGILEGRHVANVIEELAFYKKIKRIKWSVHSANTPAKKSIFLSMNSAERFWDQQ